MTAMPEDLAYVARAWLADDPDPETRAELDALLAGNDESAVAERFSGRLAFGTAGLRGVLGAGPMRMNRVVVQQVSAGLAAYLAETVPDARARGVVIGYDGRKNSLRFAHDTAEIFLGAGFAVAMTDDVCPTPVAAYAVLARKAAGGIMVTASHNPPEYNGYKVYWENGAQIIPPHDSGIAAAIDAVGPTRQLPRGDVGDVTILGDELRRAYLDGVRNLAVHPTACKDTPLTVAYTPLHGVGAASVEAALGEAGVTVMTEPSQREPDGAFPTVAFPNPEEDGAMDLVVALASEAGADLVLANDPDADRLAVALPDDGGYVRLTGDQVGALLADYLLSESPDEAGRLVATTIVSSQLLSHMAKARGVAFRETLTGFKWIANAALDHRAAGGGPFVMGYEEALGYSIGELVRDKDGVSAAALFCEMAALDKSHGRTVSQRLESIYREHGVFVTEQVSLVLPGAEGKREIDGAMHRFRTEPPTSIGGRDVATTIDIANGTDDLPPSNVLVYLLGDGSRVIMRPSGTEPKLKSYYEVREQVDGGESLGDAIGRAQRALAELRDAHQAMLRG